MVLPAKPRTDLCPFCHARTGLLRASNLTDGEKSQVIISIIVLSLVEYTCPAFRRYENCCACALMTHAVLSSVAVASALDDKDDRRE